MCERGNVANAVLCTRVRSGLWHSSEIESEPFLKRHGPGATLGMISRRDTNLIGRVLGLGQAWWVLFMAVTWDC